MRRCAGNETSEDFEAFLSHSHLSIAYAFIEATQIPIAPQQPCEVRPCLVLQVAYPNDYRISRTSTRVSEGLSRIAGASAFAPSEPRSLSPRLIEVSEGQSRIPEANAFAPSLPSPLPLSFSFRKCRFPAMQALMMMADIVPSHLSVRSMESTALTPMSSSIGRFPPSTLRPGARGETFRDTWC